MAIIWTKNNETYTDYGTTGYPVVARPTYEGAVVRVHGRDVRVMSDVWAWVTYAEVWNGEKLIDVPTAYSEPESFLGTATVDATPAVLEAVAEYHRIGRLKFEAYQKAEAEARQLAEAKRLEKGKTVKVVKGRKVAKGTTGVCIWLGEGQWGMRVGIKDAEGNVHWTAADNVEVTL